MTVEHDEAGGRFFVRVGDDEAELVYALVGPKLIDLQHTFVPESARGHGLADELSKAAVTYTRERGYRIVPTCPFVRRWLQAHPDEAKLVDPRYARLVEPRAQA